MIKYCSLLLMCCVTLSCAAEPDCENANSTLEINHCASVELEAAERRMQHYLQQSLEHHRDDAELLAAIGQSQVAWEAYAAAHCGAIYTLWRDGTIRSVLSISCQTQLARERTHQLWSAYLTFMDDSPPVLPEPLL